MKKFSYHLLNIPIVIAVLFSGISCKKEKDEPEKQNYIAAKVNGSPWTPSALKCVLLEDDTLNFRILNLTATYGGKTISVEADDHGNGATINTGTRTFDTGSAFFSYSASNIPYVTTSGSINITSNDPAAQLVSGSFSFTSTDDDGNIITVADGIFEKVEYSRKGQ